MKNCYLQILDQDEGTKPFVLATVTRAIGSTPQKPGSSALFGKNGLISGTVGGGIVEGKIQAIALVASLNKESGHFYFNLANEISSTEEAICGGQISVLVDANPENYTQVFEQIKQSLQNRVPGVLITMVTRFTEKVVLVNRYWITESLKPLIPEAFLDKIYPVAMSIIRNSDSSDFRELELSITGKEPSSLFFLEPVFPPAHLVIIGAGHIGKALAHLGHRLDFDVTIIDDRPEFANSENIPDADNIICSDISKAIQEIRKNNDTYVVIVTRGHKDDAAALKNCIASDLKYIGMIGSSRKISAMKHLFIENSFATPSQWGTIYAPIGLDIHSQSVEEIAISIAAQLVKVRNSRK